MSKDTKRWFLSQDDSFRWYLVEVTHRAEWEEWVDRLGGDDADEVPLWARAIDDPSEVTFQCPQARE